MHGEVHVRLRCIILTDHVHNYIQRLECDRSQYNQKF